MDKLFKCGNDKCPETISAVDYNDVKLEVLRRWARTCPKCGTKTIWTEQTSLLNTQTNQKNGGSNNAESIKHTNKNTKSKSGLNKAGNDRPYHG